MVSLSTHKLFLSRARGPDAPRPRQLGRVAGSLEQEKPVVRAMGFLCETVFSM